MSPEQYNGCAGVTTTEVSTAGRIEIDGTRHDATTTGDAIPAGTSVVVTGWRLAPNGGFTLSVRVRQAGEPAVLPRMTPPADVWPTGGFYDETGSGWWLLTFGQVVSVLVCLAAPVYVLYALARAAEPPARGTETPGTWTAVLGSAGAFGYSAAMFVVFGRVKRLPPATGPESQQ